ncbi:MAG: hypothetical protein KC561_21310, partial [Myxococcales bacterium]|nr:hypothetical protein [Myxococcales bacterium]
LLSVQDAKALMTADTPRPRSMDGLVPFLWIRPWQITFVDVTGRAGGMPGQIIVSNEGTLTIIHQSLERWLETQLAWLEEGILFQNPEPLRRDAIHARLNGPFGTDFHRLVD